MGSEELEDLERLFPKMRDDYMRERREHAETRRELAALRSRLANAEAALNIVGYANLETRLVTNLYFTKYPKGADRG